MSRWYSITQTEAGDVQNPRWGVPPVPSKLSPLHREPVLALLLPQVGFCLTLHFIVVESNNMTPLRCDFFHSVLYLWTQLTLPGGLGAVRRRKTHKTPPTTCPASASHTPMRTAVPCHPPPSPDLHVAGGTHRTLVSGLN